MFGCMLWMYSLYCVEYASDVLWFYSVFIILILFIYPDLYLISDM